MLRVGERKGISSSLTLIPRVQLEKTKPTEGATLKPGPSVPLIARDAYVAETSNKLEQLQATVRLLTRDIDQLADKVSELEGTADQDKRWYRFQQSERRGREAKLDEMLRRWRDLKARLDKMDARSGGDYHAYNSFEAVSRKLAELEHFKDEAQRVERRVTLRAWMFCGALALSAVIIAASNIMPG